MRKMVGLLCLSILFGICFHIPAAAFSQDEESAMSPLSQLQDRIYRGLVAYQDSIFLQDLQVTPEDGMKIYKNLLLDQPRLFYVGTRVSYAYTHDGYLTELYPSYTMPLSDIQKGQNTYREHIHHFAESVASISRDWAEWKKALYIHDYLATSYTYSEQGEEIYHAYGLFTEGHGVCQAFAMAFVALGRAIGLEVDVVASTEMDHAWNHVKIKGVYYHVDVTRDLPNAEQTLQHDRFLMSDAEAFAKGYSQYICTHGHLCSSSFAEGTDNLFSRLEGKIYPTPNGFVAFDALQGLQYYVSSGENINALPFVLTKELDVNGDGDTTVGDMISLTQTYGDIPPHYLNSFRDFLLAKKPQKRDSPS